MTLRVVATISDEHTYDECEIQLSNTSYFFASDHGIMYAHLDVDSPKIVDYEYRKGLCSRVENDLLNLGLMTDCVSVQGLV